MEFYLKLVKCVKQVPNVDKLEITYSVYVSSCFEYFAHSSAHELCWYLNCVGTLRAMLCGRATGRGDATAPKNKAFSQYHN